MHFPHGYLKFLLVLVLGGSVISHASGDEPPFLSPPQYVGPPGPAHAATNRAFQGIPSLAVAPEGRIWANWYAGVTPGEDHNNYVVVSTSGDGGEGNTVSDSVELRQLVSEASGGRE